MKEEVVEVEKRQDNLTIALVGNPNVGKTTIFNSITGLKQKVGNYPGVTVDKRFANLSIKGQSVTLIDLPGTYSIYPNSEDEIIVHRLLNGLDTDLKPDAVLAIADSSNMERGLFLVTQIIDLGIPVALVLNMEDVAEEQGLKIKTHDLYKNLQVPIILSNARSNKGQQAIEELISSNSFHHSGEFLNCSHFFPEELAKKVQAKFGFSQPYQAYQLVRFYEKDKIISSSDKQWIKNCLTDFNYDISKAQMEETRLRYQKIQGILDSSVEKTNIQHKRLTDRLDKIFLHKIGGYVLFLSILLLIFQAVFAWAEVPMGWIDGFFADLSQWINDLLPEGVLTDLLTDGIIPGIGGIVIFIPQIALLFGFLAILEDTGYMSRVVFLMDRLMRPFGLNGKSVVPLISSVACAIPGIMATRNIGNWKDRMITIMVAPLMTCAARLPVYVILIGIAVPNGSWGPFQYQGLALLGMYLLGIVAVLGTSIILKWILKTKQRSYLMIEMPLYRLPRWKDVALSMFSNASTFVLAAGKVILAISIVLWVLASYGPPGSMESAENSVAVPVDPNEEDQVQYENEVAGKKLEASYIGILGKTIEPAIRPLGYDWKIGIALITSFAAREVFVSTIATIYSIGGDVENEMTIREKLENEVNPNTGEKVFNLASSFSLLVFYAFAMQCMSTLAVVYRETKGWKWPLIQTVYMTALAYVSAWTVYQILS